MWFFIKFCLSFILFIFLVMVIASIFLIRSASAETLTPNQLPQQSRTGDRLEMKGNRVVTVDEFGETRHNKPKYVVEDNCLVPTDVFGVAKRNEGKVCFNKR